MAGFEIGISGINAARRALDVIGNNIANAGTDGYQRQEIMLTPAFSVPIGEFYYGQGVEIDGVRRIVDELLNAEILRQNSSMTQLGRELSALKMIETNFAELSDSGLSNAIDDFFNAINEFSLQPQSQVYESKLINAASTLSSKFNSASESLSALSETVIYEAEAITDEINTLADSIADLNRKIVSYETIGASANDLRNERDQVLARLSELVEINTINRDDGSVDVTIRATGDIIAMGGQAGQDFSVNPIASGIIGFGVANLDQYVSSLTGGELGGLLRLNNEYIKNIEENLNTLFRAITVEFNKLHSQGLGPNGAFSNLSGKAVGSSELSQWQPPLDVPARLYINITDTAADTRTRTYIELESDDTISTIAAKLDAISGINAYVNNAGLYISSDSGYKFDFLPGANPAPSTDFAASTATAAISGIYSGTTDDTYTFTVSGSGDIGVDDPIAMVITNSAGDVVKTVNIGLGYEAGTNIEIENGLKFSLSTGAVVNGDSFTSQALASSDPSGFLAAAGLNTFFSGTSAGLMSVDASILNGTRKVAVSLGSEVYDNSNIIKFKSLATQTFSDLENKTLTDYYQNITADLGQSISITEMKFNGLDAVVKSLKQRRDDNSGVDINAETTKLMAFEQMFQGCSKYISVCKQVMDELFSVI